MTNIGVDQVMTVTGPIDPSELGVTLMHEHLYIDLFKISGRYDAAGMIDDDDLIAEEVSLFKAEGGRSIVELTLPGIGRAPERLKAISERTGVQIVMGSGWYREPYYPAEDRIDRRTVDDIATELIDEIENGWRDTGIRPGVIGEIGIDKNWVSAQEERVLRACGRAQVATGLYLNTHAVRGGGLAQLAVLLEEGVDLSRVVIGHADSYPLLDYHLGILDAGATVAFDNIGDPRLHEGRVLRLLLDLLERGFREQIVLSHDVCYDHSLTAYGGKGYVYLQREFIPKLIEAGVGEDTVQVMTVDNPRRLITRRGRSTRIPR
ncbi:MAG: phosphotriesterase-related protein [Chloroflexi bacterium]|nr:phosphotriesterase-related protein [Chloroflexota bacterium]